MELLSTVFYFLIVIGVLVFIHELGHFLAARMCGMRADVFSLGMGSRLFGYNKITGFSFGKLPEDWEGNGHTDYRVAVLPIGGYVKIAGMVDESMDTEFINAEPQPWEFRSKNTLQKAFVISAGVIMNFLLAIAVFSGIAYTQGKTSIGTTTVASVSKNSLGEKIGFQPGDKILSVDGKQTKSWDEIFLPLATKDYGKRHQIEVQRGNEKKILSIEGKEIISTISKEPGIGVLPAGMAVVINGVETLKPAGKSGLKAGDTILSINGEKIVSSEQFARIVKGNPEKPLQFEWKRGNETVANTIAPDKTGMIGVSLGTTYAGPTFHEQYGLGESLVAGAKQTWNTVEMFVGNIVQMFKGNVSFKSSVDGPIMIAKMAKQQGELGLVEFLSFLGILSVTLAVINILPLPALDGGHLVFILLEGITRREVPAKVKIAFQQAGVVLLLLLMVFVFYNDITR